MTNEAVAEQATTGSDDEQVETTSVMLSIPVQLKSVIKQRAEGEGKSVSAFIRGMVAEQLGYTGRLGNARRRRKYATEEERKAVQDARNTARRNLMKQLMEKYESELQEQAKAAEEAALAKVRGSTDNGSAPVTQPPTQFDADSESESESDDN